MMLLATGGGLTGAAHTEQTEHAFIPMVINSSTIPSNGDLNPYGVAFVPADIPTGGLIAPGLAITKKTQIAGGYTHVPNAAAVVLGPTGLAFDSETDTLYVASTADNAIYAVSRASQRSDTGGRGRLVFDDSRLRGPLALRFAPNGHLLPANGDAVNGDPLHPSEIIEFTRSGHFVRAYDVDPSQGGAFGIDTVLRGKGLYNYAVVDDVTNSISVYRLPDAQ
jgi:DNA-binding beta-propeller fold protein YncE